MIKKTLLLVNLMFSIFCSLHGTGNEKYELTCKSVITSHLTLILNEDFSPKLSLVENVIGKDEVSYNENKTKSQKYLIQPLLSLLTLDNNPSPTYEYEKVMDILLQLEEMKKMEEKNGSNSLALYFSCYNEASILYDIIAQLQPDNTLPFRFYNNSDLEFTNGIKDVNDFYDIIFDYHQIRKPEKDKEYLQSGKYFYEFNRGISKTNDSSRYFRQFAINASISPLQMRPKESAFYYWVKNSSASSAPILDILSHGLERDINSSHNKEEIKDLLRDLKEISSQRGGMMYQIIFQDLQDLNKYGYACGDFGRKKMRPGLINKTIFSDSYLGESLKFLKLDLELYLRHLGLNDSAPEEIRDLDNFQARIYIHPELQQSNKIKLYAYPIRKIDKTLEDEYQNKISIIAKYIIPLMEKKIIEDM